MARDGSNKRLLHRDTPEFLTTGQVASLFGVSFKTVIRWEKSGRLTGVRLPGSRGDRRFSRESVLEFAERNHLDSLVLEARRKPLVLLADDEPNVVSSIQRILHGRCDFATASDGYQAGVIMGLRQPTLVLLDLHMPNLDGFAVLNYMQTVPELRGIPVWIVSGCTEELRRRAIDAGATGAIAKPFTGSQILNAFESAHSAPRDNAEREAA